MSTHEPFHIVESLEKFENDDLVSYVCPHCGVAGMLSYDQIKVAVNSIDAFHAEVFARVVCLNPSCKKAAVFMEEYESRRTGGEFNDMEEFLEMSHNFQLQNRMTIYPEAKSIPLMFEYQNTRQYIPELIYDDFILTQRLLSISTNATIVFARRTLERIILDKWPDVVGAPHKEGELPSLASMLNWLEEQGKYSEVITLKALKNIANYATHIMDPNQNITFSIQEAHMILLALDKLITDVYIKPGENKEYQIRMNELAGVVKGLKNEQIQATLKRGQAVK